MVLIDRAVVGVLESTAGLEELDLIQEYVDVTAVVLVSVEFIRVVFEGVRLKPESGSLL